MIPEDDETVWRNRFILINLVRIGATAFVLFALAIWYTDLLVPGGSMLIGMPLALAGVVVSFLGPRWMARHWRTPPPA